MASMKRIYLYGYFGARNIGDDLLLDVTINNVRRVDSETEFLVRTVSEGNLDKDLKKVYSVDLEMLLSCSTEPKIKRLVKYLYRQWKSLAGCSSFIFSGGTVFHARNGSLVNLTIIAFLTIFARLRGAKVYAIGVGVAPLPSLMARLLMVIVIGLSRDFAVRDHRSKLNCSIWPFREKCRLTSDLVFSSKILEQKTHKSAVNKKSVCFTVASSDISADLDKYIGFQSEFNKTVSYLLENGWNVTLLSFQELTTHSAQLSDRQLFLNMTDGGKGINMIKAEPSALDLISLLSEFSVVAGMRFHSLVLSALGAVPFVGFGRDHKNSDLCERFAMPFIHLDAYRSTDMLAAIERASAIEVSPDVLLELRKASESNFQYLERDLK
jgi:polysaccharide pyruvyl transferase WcaK-like protein